MDPARESAVDVLVAWDPAKRFAKDLLAERRDETQDPRDRGFTREIVLGVARRRATIDHLLAGVSATPLWRLDPVVRAALRAAVAQLLFLDRVPAHAAVDGAVEIVKARANARLAGFTNGVLRTLVRGIEGPAAGAEDPRRDVPRAGAASIRLRTVAFPATTPSPDRNLAIRFAHPEWLVARWRGRHGDATARAMLEGGISRPPAVLRVRGADRDAALAALAAAGVVASAGGGPSEIRIAGPSGGAGAGPKEVRPASPDPSSLAVVREGLASVEGATVQRVAPLLDARPGDRILVLRASPGGAVLHVADLLGGRGEVVAADVDAEKVGALAAFLASRLPAGGVRVEAVLVPRDGPLPFAPGSFHGVLVEAPSSETGILRRRPEACDRLRAGDVRAFADAQRALLARALPLVRPGGRLVHATRSVEPEEGEGLVASFAAEHPGLRLEPGFDVLPGVVDDGGFAAILHVA